MKKSCSILIIIILALFAGLFGWGSIMRSIRNETMARDRTAAFAADLSQSELKVEGIIYGGFIQLPESKVVHLNDEIRLYVKMKSHHNEYTGDYTFLNINGKVYSSGGPCRDWVTEIPLPSIPIEYLKEDELVEFLIGEGFHEIESNKALHAKH